MLLALLMGLGWGAASPAVAQGDPTPTPTLAPFAPLPELGTFVQACGSGGRKPAIDFPGGGVIVTTLSRDAIWVIDLDRPARYPLEQTLPCGPNCRPSPDHRDLLYVEPSLATFWLMAVDGTNRRPAFPYYVSELDWWDATHWLVWPTAGRPAIYPVDGGDPQRFADYHVYSLQPGGYWGLRLEPADSEYPLLQLVNVETGATQDLLLAQPYTNGAYWSPDGSRLAYLGLGERDRSLNQRGAELYLITPGDPAGGVRLTDLTGAYGAVRIAGLQEARAVSWSPDGTRLAFWVMEIVGPDEAADVGQAVVHVLDVASGQITVYCGFGVTLDPDAPSVPALIWSPDGRYLAFGVEIPGDDRAALLLGLDTESGDNYELSEGIYAAYGTYDPVMWGIKYF